MLNKFLPVCVAFFLQSWRLRAVLFHPCSVKIYSLWSSAQPKPPVFTLESEVRQVYMHTVREKVSTYKKQHKFHQWVTHRVTHILHENHMLLSHNSTIKPRPPPCLNNFFKWLICSLHQRLCCTPICLVFTQWKTFLFVLNRPLLLVFDIELYTCLLHGSFVHTFKGWTALISWKDSNSHETLHTGL